MGAMFDIVGYLAKPLVLAALVLVMLGLLDADSNPRAGTSGSFDCRGFTDDPEWNRIMCQYHPGRLLNTPVSDFLPSFGKSAGPDA